MADLRTLILTHIQRARLHLANADMLIASSEHMQSDVLRDIAQARDALHDLELTLGAFQLELSSARPRPETPRNSRMK